MENPLRAFLDEKGLRPGQVAAKCKIAPVTVSRHLSGARGISAVCLELYSGIGVPVKAMLAWNRHLAKRADTPDA
jgi:hypothetical protein